jgi:hypothetical protein
MTHEEYRQCALAACASAAEDVKNTADYCAYSFSQSNEADGRKYFESLQQHMTRLRTEIHTLDYANRQIAAASDKSPKTTN